MAFFNVYMWLAVCLFFTLQGDVFAEQTAPALIWSPERSMSSLPDASSVDSGTFVKDYLKPLMQKSSESAVVFLQNKLHVDDFTKFADVYSLDSDGGAFKNIKGFMEEHFSLEVPHVEDPLAAVQQLKSSFDGVVHTVNSLAEVEGLGLGPDQRFLLVVELVPAQLADEEQAIAANDATVGAICHHLKERSVKYTALFTGKPASARKLPAVETHSGRHLLATADSNNGTFMNVSGMFIFLHGVEVRINTPKQQLNFNFSVPDTAAANSTVSNKTALIQLDLKGTSGNSSGDYDVQIVFNTTLLGDRWTIKRISLTVEGPAGTDFNGTLTDTTLQTGDMDLVVPILYSYHCSSMKMYVDSVRDKSLKDFKGTYVQLNGFQLQPFNVQGNKFFNAQDCVGFFTRGIWMGIVPSLILLAILLFGTMMVLNLSTPDRFDDPKGKSIVIAQAED